MRSKIATEIALTLVITLAQPTATNADTDYLAGIQIEPELDGADYKRSMFNHWIDEDGDGQRTRDEVLIEESLVPVSMDESGRKVVQGLWFCPFTGKTFIRPKREHSNYAQVQIDHIVPLKEAYESGARRWTPAGRQAYANDLNNPGHLMAVDGPTNGSKGFKDPAEWLPPNADFHCAYVLAWIEIKRNWDLSIDDVEAQALRTTLNKCPLQ